MATLEAISASGQEEEILQVRIKMRMINNIMEKIKAHENEATNYILTDEQIFMQDPTIFRNISLTINELGKKLLQAALEGSVEDIKQLLAKGAPFTADWLGTSPLHLAAQHNHLEICEIFLRAGMCKDTRTKVERTPLHMATYEGHTEIVDCLLRHNADPDSRDMLHMTPLHWAVQRGHAEIATSLIRSGASTEVINKFGLTPMDIAFQVDRADIVEIINYTIRDPLSATKHLVELSNENSIKETVEPIMHLNIHNNNEPMDEPQQIIDQDHDHDQGIIMFDPGNHFLLQQQEQQQEQEQQQQEEDVDEPREYIETIDIEDINNEINENDPEPDISEAEPETETETNTFNESMKLLQQHGITMLPDGDEENNILNSVMESGHSVVLTEAGKQALKSISAEKLLPQATTLSVKKPIIKKKKIITVTADQFLAMTSTNSSTLRIVNGKLVDTKPKRVVKRKTIDNLQEAKVVIETYKRVVVKTEYELQKCNALVDAYRKRLAKTEHELAKYKQKCKVLMESTEFAS